MVAPQHIAMIMDGNGRWAKKRHLPRVAGHARGVKRVRDIVEFCITRDIRYLTLFAFSTENWKRPADEVNHLMGLFVSALEGEVNKLYKNGVRLRVVGDLQPFNPRLQTLIASAEARTSCNDRLTLTIAANYGGQWDIRQAFGGWLKARQAAGLFVADQVNPEDIDLKPYLSMAYAPDPDLVIRTGGEQRISNFLLWQSAYAELYFTDALWPAFTTAEMELALVWYGLLATLLLSGSLLSGQALAEVAESAAIRSKPALLRMSYEVVDVGPAETMGFAGVHYLVNVHPNWYVGASGFGALAGERGGFFTGGFTVGTGMRFASKWLLDAGLFVGGGGGGAAGQGGGLMVRPHLGISRDVGGVMLGAGVSYINFPNGDIDSTQLSLSLGIPFDVYYGRASDAGKTVYAGDLAGLSLQQTEWLATVGKYHPAGKAKTTAGKAMTSSLKRVGFEYRRHLDARRYFFVETAGAMGGESDGFAELLAGAGYRVPLLSPRVHLTASLAVGGAGGGRVDTGGGLVGKARVGLDYDLTPALKLGLDAGRMESAGSFSADFYGLSLGYRLGEVGTGRFAQDGQGLAGVRLARWRLIGVQHTNFSATRNTGHEQNLSLVGLKIEKFLTDSFYMTGQAHGAYAGDAGGYAVGLIGAGWEIPLREDGRLSFNAEFAAGAAGGGGVDVGSGAVIQPLLGLSWRISQQLAVRLEAGRIKALNGELDSNLAGLGLAYEFSRPEYRYE